MFLLLFGTVGVSGAPSASTASASQGSRPQVHPATGPSPAEAKALEVEISELVSSGRNAEAIRMFEGLPAGGEATVDLLLSVAECYRTSGLPDKAAALFKAAWLQEPANKRASQGLVLSLFDAGKQGEAMEVMQRLHSGEKSEKHPLPPPDAQTKPEEPAAAATAPDATSPELSAEMAEQLLKSARPAEAEAVVDKALVSSAGHPALMLARVRVLAYKRLWVDAAHLLDNIAALPGVSSNLISDNRDLVLTGALTNAIPEDVRAIRAALDAADTSPTLQAVYIASLAACGQNQEAIAFFEAWPEKQSASPALTRIAAGCYEMYGNIEAASELYQRLLDKNAGNSEAWRSLVRLLTKQAAAAGRSSLDPPNDGKTTGAGAKHSDQRKTD